MASSSSSRSRLFLSFWLGERVSDSSVSRSLLNSRGLRSRLHQTTVVSSTNIYIFATGKTLQKGTKAYCIDLASEWPTPHMAKKISRPSWPLQLVRGARVGRNGIRPLVRHPSPMPRVRLRLPRLPVPAAALHHIGKQKEGESGASVSTVWTRASLPRKGCGGDVKNEKGCSIVLPFAVGSLTRPDCKAGWSVVLLFAVGSLKLRSHCNWSLGARQGQYVS
jgi:hypothetical protein